MVGSPKNKSGSFLSLRKHVLHEISLHDCLLGITQCPLAEILNHLNPTLLWAASIVCVPTSCTTVGEFPPVLPLYLKTLLLGGKNPLTVPFRD